MSNQPHRPAIWHHHLDLTPLRILAMCNLSDHEYTAELGNQHSNPLLQHKDVTQKHTVDIIHTSTMPLGVHGTTLQLMVATYDLLCYGTREGSIPIYRAR